MKLKIKTLSLLAVATVLTVPSANIFATDKKSSEQLALKTSVAEVNGVREIESGQFEKGIRRSKASLEKSSTITLRKPLLDNLCVAHVAINDMEQAKQYCDAAVNTGKATSLSYNNRAVLHYVTGNLQASIEDLDTAKEIGSFKPLVERNMAIVSQQSMITKH